MRHHTIRMPIRLPIQKSLLMRPAKRRSILQPPRTCLHPIRILISIFPRHSIVAPIKPQPSNPLIPLNPRRLLKPRRNIIAHLPKNSKHALLDLLITTIRNMPRYIPHKSLARPFVPDLLPQRARRVEVLRPDLAQERDCLADKVRVHSIQIDSAVAEGNRLDRGQIIGPGALVVEGHSAVALEVTSAVFRAGRVDW